MKKYEEMSGDEILRIVNKGGADLVKLNQEVADYLDKLDLSERAKYAISDTEISCIAEMFGGLFTAADIEEYVNQTFTEEDF